MMCENCKKMADGNYCSTCGSLLRAPSEADQKWQEKLDFNLVSQSSEVRKRLTDASAVAPNRLTGEEILSGLDSVFSLAGGTAVMPVVNIVVPLYSKLGIRARKKRSERFTHPPGMLLASALTSLTRMGISVENVVPGVDGCVLEGEIPSDFWSFKGSLLLTFGHSTDHTWIEGATLIRGQAYDWGKSRRILDQLFADLQILRE